MVAGCGCTLYLLLAEFDHLCGWCGGPDNIQVVLRFFTPVILLIGVNYLRLLSFFKHIWFILVIHEAETGAHVFPLLEHFHCTQ